MSRALENFSKIIRGGTLVQGLRVYTSNFITFLFTMVRLL